MSMWSLRWHFTNKPVTGAPYSIKSYSYTVGHYGEEYDDWNSAALRSRRKCSNDGAERTDDGRAFHARAAVTAEGSITQRGTSCIKNVGFSFRPFLGLLHVGSGPQQRIFWNNLEQRQAVQWKPLLYIGLQWPNFNASWLSPPSCG